MSYNLQIIRTLDTYDGTTLSAVVNLQNSCNFENPKDFQNYPLYYIHFCGYDFENNGPVYFCKPLGENDQFYLTEGLIPVRDFLLSPESPLTIIRTHSANSWSSPGCWLCQHPTPPTNEDLKGLPEEGVYLNG